MEEIRRRTAGTGWQLTVDEYIVWPVRYGIWHFGSFLSFLESKKCGLRRLEIAMTLCLPVLGGWDNAVLSEVPDTRQGS